MIHETTLYVRPPWPFVIPMALFDPLCSSPSTQQRPFSSVFCDDRGQLCSSLLPCIYDVKHTDKGKEKEKKH